MNRLRQLGLVLIVLAIVFLAWGAAFSFWQATGFTSLLLLLLSGIVYVFDYSSRKAGLRGVCQFVVATVIILSLFFLFAPAVQTLPSNGGSGTFCDSRGCSSIIQLQSLTNYLWCYGGEYQYSFPPATSFMFWINLGCLPHQ